MDRIQEIVDKMFRDASRWAFSSWHTEVGAIKEGIEALRVEMTRTNNEEFERGRRELNDLRYNFEDEKDRLRGLVKQMQDALRMAVTCNGEYAKARRMVAEAITAADKELNGTTESEEEYPVDLVEWVNWSPIPLFDLAYAIASALVACDWISPGLKARIVEELGLLKRRPPQDKELGRIK